MAFKFMELNCFNSHNEFKVKEGKVFVVKLPIKKWVS